MFKKYIFIIPLFTWALCLFAPSFVAKAATTQNNSAQTVAGTAKQDGSIRIVDDTGYELVLKTPAKRVIALYGALSELMLALDLGDTLVARTAADRRIVGLKHLPAVGTHMRPNPELIVSLKPDVILQFLGREEAASLGLGLRKMGVPVLLFHLESFEDMFSVLTRLGKMGGKEAKATELVKGYRKRIGDLRNILLDIPRVSVFYEVRYPNLLGAGPKSIVADIINVAGGRNILTTDERLVRLNEEELVYKNPEAYIIQKGPMNPDPRPVDERPHYATLQAVKNKRVLEVSELEYARPGPKSVDAVEKLARWLHPTVDFTVKKP